MRTEIFRCDFDIGDENHWRLLDEGAKQHGLPREEILFVFRISFPDNRKDRSFVVPAVHNNGGNLLNTALSCVSWYSEERPSWDADVMDGHINRVRRTDNVTKFLPWEEPEDERLTTLFIREKQIPAFVVAVSALQDGFETIDAAAVFMDGDESIDESDRMRNFFHKISQMAKEGTELPEIHKLKTALQEKEEELTTAKERIEKLETENKTLQDALQNEIPQPWDGVAELMRLIAKHPDDPIFVFNKLLKYEWKKIWIALLLPGDGISIKLDKSKGIKNMLEGRLKTFSEKYGDKRRKA